MELRTLMEKMKGCIEEGGRQASVKMCASVVERYGTQKDRQVILAGERSGDRENVRERKEEEKQREKKREEKKEEEQKKQKSRGRERESKNRVIKNPSQRYQDNNNNDERR